MKIATYMTAAPKLTKGTPRPARTYRADRRNMAAVEYQSAKNAGRRNDPTIQRATYRPLMMPHQGKRECERRVRQGLAPVAVALAAE